MRTNQEGFELIKIFEGLRLHAYKCPAGVWTIGYGNTKYLNGREVRQGDQITAQQASDMFVKTVTQFEKYVDALLKVSLNANQYSAIVSLCYNIGPGNLRKSKLLQLINEGHIAEAANEFDKHVTAGGKILAGLVTRRAAEKHLYLKA